MARLERGHYEFRPYRYMAGTIDMSNFEIGKTEQQYHPVNKPAHYNRKGIEAIQAIEAASTEDEFIGYLRGNILKYQWRAPHKSNYIQDLEKAEWYSKLLKEKLEEYGKTETGERKQGS